MIFLEKKIITSLNIDASPGYFALDNSPFKWENCRERFHKIFIPSTEGFYFKHFNEQGVNLATFLNKIELVLKIINFSEFAETNKDSILWIAPSIFWKSCMMRRSLLTILLRCGLYYDKKKDNFDEAIFCTNEYAVSTKRALMRFLFGFTNYIGPDISSDNITVQVRGWQMIFENKNDIEIRNMLVAPEKAESCFLTENFSFLWI